MALCQILSLVVAFKFAHSLWQSSDIHVEGPYTGCHDGWVAFEGYCYYFEAQTGPFLEAEHFCRQHDSHLIEVDNALENAFVKDYLKRLRPVCGWLGAMDNVTEGSWAWLNSQTPMNFTDWYPGQDVSAAEDCGTWWVQFGYKWADYVCTAHCMPICKSRGGIDFVDVLG